MLQHVCKPRTQTHGGTRRWRMPGAAITHTTIAQEEPGAALRFSHETLIRVVAAPRLRQCQRLENG